MGKILKIENVQELIPTQNYLIKKRYYQLLPLIRKTDKKLIIAVKHLDHISGDKLLIIDGHHTSSIVDYLNSIGHSTELYGYFPDNKRDLIKGLPEGFYKGRGFLPKINDVIRYRFDDLETGLCWFDLLYTIRQLRERSIHPHKRKEAS